MYIHHISAMPCKGDLLQMFRGYLVHILATKSSKPPSKLICHDPPQPKVWGWKFPSQYTASWEIGLCLIGIVRCEYVASLCFDGRSLALILISLSILNNKQIGSKAAVVRVSTDKVHIVGEGETHYFQIPKYYPPEHTMFCTDRWDGIGTPLFVECADSGDWLSPDLFKSRTIVHLADFQLGKDRFVFVRDCQDI